MDGISWKFAKVSSCRSSKNQHGLNPLLDNGYDVLVILELTDECFIIIIMCLKEVMCSLFCFVTLL